MAIVTITGASALDGRHLAEPGQTTGTPGALDAALRAGDLARAEELVLDDVNGADQVFLTYLDDTARGATASFGTATPPAIERARRLSGVFFAIYELDFERAIVAEWERSTTARTQALLPILREHFAVWRDERAVDDGPTAPLDVGRRLLARYTDLAVRYRAAAFGKGESQALLNATAMDSALAWRTWQQAKAQKDEVIAAWAAYEYSYMYGEAQSDVAAKDALAAAERLRLPRLLEKVLTRLAWRVNARDDFDAHVGYFRRGLAVVQGMPVRRTMVTRVSRSAYPAEAWFCARIGRTIAGRNAEESRQLLARGRALSREHGGEVGELAWLISVMSMRFEGQGLAQAQAADAEALARRLADPGWLAKVLLEKATGLSATRDFGGAAAAITAAAEIYRRAGDQGHVAAALERRGAARANANDLPAAAADFAEAIRLYRDLGLTSRAVWAGIGAGQALRARPAEARAFIDPAVEAARQTGEADLIAYALEARAAFILPNAPSDGLQDALKALDYYERASQNAGYPQLLLNAMASASGTLSSAGFVAEAMDIQRRRAALARDQGFPDLEVDAYAWMQRENARLGNLAEAAEAVRRWEAVIGQPGRGSSVTDQDRIALAYAFAGQPALALAHWTKALEMARGTPDRVRFERTSHANIGLTLRNLGDYGGAIREFEAELKLYDRTAHLWAGPLELQKAEWQNKVAFTHALAGDAAKSLEASLEAIRFENAVPGSNLARYIGFYTPGDALGRAGRTDEALAFYQKRLERARAIKSSRDERTALEQVGAAFLAAGRIDDARQSFAGAVAINRQPPGPQTGALATSLLGAAKVEMAAGDLAKAESLLTEARETANPYDFSQYWQIDRALAQTFVRAGRHDRARAQFDRALASLESVHERLRPEEFVLRYGVDRWRVYDEYASYLAARAIDTMDQADIAAPLAVVERRRAEVLWDRLATGWSRVAPEALPVQLQQAQELRAEMAARQNGLRDQYGLAPAQRNAALIKTLEAGLEKAREAHARAIVTLAQGQFRHASPAGLPADLAARLQQRLGPGQALVEYLVSDDAVWAFVVTEDGHALRRLPLGRDALRTRVRSVLAPFFGTGDDALDLARLDFDLAGAYDLYRQLVAPVEPLLRGAQQLFVVPDDVLWYLPLEMLVDRPPARAPTGRVLFAQYEEAAFLVRKYALTYGTSAASWLVPAAADPGASPPRILVLANPAAASSEPPSEQEDPLRRQLRSADLRAAFGPLASAEAEAASLRAAFPAASLTVLTGAQATESSYTNVASGHDVIHFATHGVAADDQPLYSTLLLAPDPDRREDGFLQAWEILRRPLQARLVVLSACETARGPAGQGDGMVGLVSAFQQAGARSIVATEWQIDESAARLMAAFYRSVAAGRGLPGALRAAKLEMLKTHTTLGGVDVSLSHPFFWAAFVLVGDGR